MVPTIEIDTEGNIRTLYNDVINLYDLGIVQDVKRASNVNFNQSKQNWEVVDAETGEIVYMDKNRERAIEWEIANFSPGGKLYKGE